MLIWTLIAQNGRLRGFLGFLRLIGIGIGLFSYTTLPLLFAKIDIIPFMGGEFGLFVLFLAFISTTYFYRFPWYTDRIFLVIPFSKLRLVLSVLAAALLTPSIISTSFLTLLYGVLFIDTYGIAGLVTLYVCFLCVTTTIINAKISSVNGIKISPAYAGFIVLAIPVILSGQIGYEIMMPLFIYTTGLNVFLLTKAVNRVSAMPNSPVHHAWTHFTVVWIKALFAKEFLLFFRHRKSRQQFVVGMLFQALLLTFAVYSGSRMAVLILGITMMTCLFLGEYFQSCFSAEYPALGALRMSPYTPKAHLRSKLTFLRVLILAFNLVALCYMSFITTLGTLIIVAATNVILLPHLVILVALNSYKTIDLDASIFNYNKFRRPVKFMLMVGFLGMIEIVFCMIGPIINVGALEVFICLSLLSFVLLAESRFHDIHARLYKRWLDRSKRWDSEVFSL